MKIKNFKATEEEINIDFFEESKEEYSEKIKWIDIDSSSKKELDWRKVNFKLSLLSTILTIISSSSVIFYFIFNANYKVEKKLFYSLPKQFFNIDLSEYLLLSLLIGTPIFYFGLMLANYKKYKNLEYKISAYIVLVSMEVLYVVLNMGLWAKELDEIFMDWSFYKSDRGLFVFLFIIVVTIFFLAINSTVFLKANYRNKFLNFLGKSAFALIGLSYTIVSFYVFLGKKDSYDIINILKENYVIVGYHDGEYAVATYEIDEEKNQIKIFNDDVRKVKKDIIENYQIKFFRNEILEDKKNK